MFVLSFVIIPMNNRLRSGRETIRCPSESGAKRRVERRCGLTRRPPSGRRMEISGDHSIQPTWLRAISVCIQIEKHKYRVFIIFVMAALNPVYFWWIEKLRRVNCATFITILIYIRLTCTGIPCAIFFFGLIADSSFLVLR